MTNGKFEMPTAGKMLMEDIVKEYTDSLTCDIKADFSNENVQVNLIINKIGISNEDPYSKEKYPPLIINLNEIFKVSDKMEDNSKVVYLDIDKESIDNFKSVLDKHSCVLEKISNYYVSDNYMDSFF